jgi:WD40 repeat protein
MSQQSSKYQSYTNPFPGLRAFKAAESNLFFGREEHITDVLSKLKSNHFVAVVGTSGTGKSSLIKAGVLPALAAGEASEDGEKWEVISMNPGSSPIANLADAICRIPELTGEGNVDDFEKRLVELMNESALGLVQAMRPVLAENSKMLILIDQFEEVFRFATEEEKEAKDVYNRFVRLLIETVRQRDVPIYAILTLRSDFLGDCVDFEGLPEAINDGHYLVPRMNKVQMKRAITGPIDLAEGKISPRLIQHITHDLGDNPDQLPVLQHAMMRCWDYWKTNAVAGEPMDLQHFAAIGDLDNALSTHADEAFEELTADEKLLARKVFKCLTTKKGDMRGVRRPMSLGNLMKTTQASEKEVLATIAPFRKAGCSFILPGTEIEVTEQTIYDISHESLMRGWDRLKIWVDEETDSAELYLRICTAAELHKHGSAGLWRDPELQLAIDWKENQKPIAAWAELYNDDFDSAINFIEESTHATILEKAKKTRRTRIIRLSVAAFVTVITILAAWALFQTNVAEQMAEEADLKSKEAIAQKQLAEEASELAQKSSEEAQLSSEIAKEQAEIASHQARIAQEQKQIAQKEKGKAEQAADLALTKQELADQKSKEAIEQRQMADAASAEANRLRMIATSQNLAYSSAQVTQNSELAALLAIESFSIGQDNGGETNSTSLYNAASKAFGQLVPAYSPKVTTLSNEVIAFNFNDDELCVVDNLGKFQVYNNSDYSNPSIQNTGLTATDINTAYINQFVNEPVFGLNSYALNSFNGTQLNSFSGHNGLVRAMAFRTSNPTMISGGRDKKLILWNDDKSQQAMQFESRIKTISALPDTPTILVGCENGVVYRVDLNDKSQTVFASKNSGRVEAISQTENGSEIAIGYSDGIIRVYSATGTLLKEFLGMGSVIAVRMNKANDLLAVAYSGRLLRLYALSDLTKLPIEIKMERPIKELDVNLISSEIFVYATDRTIRKYPIKAHWFISQLKSKVTRNLSEEEWKTFVGADIPFNATQANSSE